jgi:hypothetical protein
MRMKLEKEMRELAEKLEFAQRESLEKQKMLFEMRQDNDDKTRRL